MDKEIWSGLGGPEKRKWDIYCWNGWDAHLHR